jgi:hypothetical protein
VNREELKQRTKRFALEIIAFVSTFPRKKEANISACRAQSRAHFISKMSIVVEEADESQYWIELADYFKWGRNEQRNDLLNEAKELTAIFTASIKTAKSRR